MPSLNFAIDMPQVPLPRRRVWGDWRPISREQLDQLGAELRSKNIQYRVTYTDDHALVSVERKADDN